MRKVLIMLFALFFTLVLSGCENTVDKYPCVKYEPSNYRYDRRARTILIGKDDMLCDNHPYDIVETNTGYDLVLHFVKED